MERGIGLDPKDKIIIDLSPLRQDSEISFNRVDILDMINQLIANNSIFSKPDSISIENFSDISKLNWDDNVIEQLLQTQPIWRIPGKLFKITFFND